jgi:hypothetical protein
MSTEEEIQKGGKMRRVGTRAQVMHDTAHHTPGGLTKADLKYNKWGRIVSKAKSVKAKRENRLVKLGFKTQKGKFGVVKTGKKTRKSKRGGSETKGAGAFLKGAFGVEV